MAGDDGAAAASLLLGVDAILDSQASGLDGIVEDGGILVVTGTADVDDTVGGEDVLGTSGAVLSSTAGDELGIVVVEEVLVEGDVLILGEDSIVRLQVIFVKEGLVTVRLDVCCRERRSSSSARNRRRGGRYKRGGIKHWARQKGASHGKIHTKQRVLQAEEGVFLGGSHSVQLSCEEVCGG